MSLKKARLPSLLDKHESEEECLAEFLAKEKEQEIINKSKKFAPEKAK